MHHDERVLFRGCKDFLLYLPTGFEKEAWCEVLRAASKPQHAVKEWFLKYKTQYAKYCLGLAVYNHIVMTNLQRENSGNGILEETSGDPISTLSHVKQILWNKVRRWKSNGQHEVASTARGEPQDGPRSSLGDNVDQGLICFNILLSRLFFDWHQCPSRIAKYHANLQASCILLTWVMSSNS